MRLRMGMEFITIFLQVNPVHGIPCPEFLSPLKGLCERDYGCPLSPGVNALASEKFSAFTV
jgi:hypothetical protein